MEADKMNKYIIMYDASKSIFSDYQTIEGKTPKDALKKHFNKDFERLTDEEGRFATIILVKGELRGKTIYYPRKKCQRLCFKECS